MTRVCVFVDLRMIEGISFVVRAEYREVLFQLNCVALVFFCSRGHCSFAVLVQRLLFPHERVECCLQPNVLRSDWVAGVHS